MSHADVFRRVDRNLGWTKPDSRSRLALTLWAALIRSDCRSKSYR